ncbi:anthranilate synthase component I family protein [Abortiporus biennis]
MPDDSPRILLIDSYDSFTYNLASLCRRAIPNCIVHIVENDKISVDQLVDIIPYLSAIVISPGPGSPANDEDIGVVKHVWKLAEEHILPIFGVCLGLQSLAIEFGASLRRLNAVKHGQISHLDHTGQELFEGISNIEAVRYHSLHVVLEDCPDLQCLAWADDGEENGRVVMALKHISKPFWAVQYHPESVRSSSGLEVIHNFWRLAEDWTISRQRVTRPWTIEAENIVGIPWPGVSLIFPEPKSQQFITRPTVVTRVTECSRFPVVDVCEAIGAAEEDPDFVMLESAAQPGRFTIIGCLHDRSTRISYSVTDDKVALRTSDKTIWEPLGSDGIWTWLARFMSSHRANGGEPSIPFWGGLVGYLSYELGLQGLTPNLSLHDSQVERHSDVNLVFVDRSIVYDQLEGKVYVQSLLADDQDWLSSIVSTLQQKFDRSNTSSSLVPPLFENATVKLPDKETYIKQIQQAKEYLFAGDSYELCLTAPTQISIPKRTNEDKSSSSWDLYKILRDRNPAPHSAYIRLHPSTLVSSSPERFLSYSRTPGSVCQLRPIKGTVRKGPGISRAVAEEALIGSKKEVAENLMIVDLIRHDLHGVVGDDVEVKQFCGVEEYETVWQLVSVIEGKVAGEMSMRSDLDVGWEVLQHSSPPGSMTGAPKKRSVEILHSLENKDRGVYSGVFGYWCVSGGGDWSVTIRSCFKHDEEDKASSELPSREVWTLGAGGAITALSDAEAEWEEMIIKVESVLRAFTDNYRAL